MDPDTGTTSTTEPAAHSSDDPPRYESRALAKGIQILECLAGSEQPLSLAQISRRIELGKASTLRLLRTLGALGYLERDGGEAYHANTALAAVNRHRTATELRAAALPELEQLRQELGESVALAFLCRDEIRVIEALESPHPVRIANHTGRLLPPYASALGKAAAAHQKPEHFQALLHAYGVFPLTPKTITEPAAIEAEMATVRQSGFARDREETTLGGECFAAPLRDAAGNVIGAVSVSLPQARLTERLESMLPEMLGSAASRITHAFQSRHLKTRETATSA